MRARFVRIALLVCLGLGVFSATAAAAEFAVTLSGRVGSLQEGHSSTAQIERLYGKPKLSPAVGRGNRDLAYNCAKGTRSVENCLTDFTVSGGRLVGFSSKVAGFAADGVSPGESADSAAKSLHQSATLMCGGAGPGFELSGHGFRILLWINGAHKAGVRGGLPRYAGGHVASIELDDMAHALAC